VIVLILATKMYHSLQEEREREAMIMIMEENEEVCREE
jgi:hypothetical protein